MEGPNAGSSERQRLFQGKFMDVPTAQCTLCDENTNTTTATDLASLAISQGGITRPRHIG